MLDCPCAVNLVCDLFVHYRQLLMIKWKITQFSAERSNKITQFSAERSNKITQFSAERSNKITQFSAERSKKNNTI